VTAGETDWVPELTGVTGPIELSIMNVSAFAVVQVRSDAKPACTDAGLAERVHIGAEGGGGSVTVTVVEHVTTPPSPLAVPV
jgi:hypothetical protein